MPLVVEQFLDFGDGQIGKLARQRSRHRNANTEEVVAGPVLSRTSLEEALQENGVVGISDFLEAAPHGGQCHRSDRGIQS